MAWKRLRLSRSSSLSSPRKERSEQGLGFGYASNSSIRTAGQSRCGPIRRESGEERHFPLCSPETLLCRGNLRQKQFLGCSVCIVTLLAKQCACSRPRDALSRLAHESEWSDFDEDFLTIEGIDRQPAYEDVPERVEQRSKGGVRN